MKLYFCEHRNYLGGKTSGLQVITKRTEYDHGQTNEPNVEPKFHT